MTLEEAIKHCHEKAEEIRKANEEMPTDCKLSEDLCECANEHEQLAEWLKDYKRLLEERQQGEWIPIKIRKLTEEEKEEYPDCTFMYDCKLPDDGEEVLVTTFAGNVTLDTFYRDDGCYFESYCDADDVIAWKPKPGPYKTGGRE